MPIGNPRPALLVPEKSLGTDQGQKYLFVVNDRDEVERRNVRLGPQLGMFRVIEDNALKTDDRVIVDGLLRVRPGTKVNPKPAEVMTIPDTTAGAVETAPSPRFRN
jgi:multidrug efflux system membrane fusion protein